MDISNKVTSLELKLLEIEKLSLNAPSDERVLQDYQEQLLAKLLSIRQSMVEEDRDYDKLKQERDNALAENKKLKDVVEKQNYRIRHLIKCLNEAEQK
jgi:hypothetical protein